LTSDWALLYNALTFSTAYIRSSSPVLRMLNTWLLSEKSSSGAGKLCGAAAAEVVVGPLPQLLLLMPAC
jgi:hypothetical protein